MDASDSSTLTLNGSTVSQWNDKSGNNCHVSQGTSANQPTYSGTAFNNRPTVFFDATNDEMACDTTGKTRVVNSQGNLFYAAVFEMLNDVIGWRMIVGTDSGSGTANQGELLLQRILNNPEIGVHNSGVQNTGAAYAVAVTNLFVPRIATVGRSGGDMLGKDGTITVTATGPSQTTYKTERSQTWNTEAATNRIMIGGRQQPGPGWSNSRISEVLVMNRNTTADERERIEGYFAHKWGLAANLPVGHPFQTTAPTVP